MLRFVGTDIVCQEYPDEITLAINISGCPCHCPGCHSSFLSQNTGQMLSTEVLEVLIESTESSISCVGFMGGDANPKCINSFARYIKAHHPELKVGWYSGRTVIASDIELCNFDYIKIGPYLKHLGGLKSKRTNQRMYHISSSGEMVDITYRFQ